MITASTQITLKVIERTRDKQIDAMSKRAQHKKSIEYFQKNIKNVQSVDDLVGDFKLYSFVMKAFGLEDQIFGKGMMKKILKSDPDDPKSLVNRMTDRRFQELFVAFDFKDGGTTNPNTKYTTWANEIVDKYLTVQFENEQAEKNPSVGAALEFQRKAKTLKTWYHVLADPEISDVMRTALGISPETAKMPVDKQKQQLERKYDIRKLQNPREVEIIMSRYAAMKDTQSATANFSLLAPATSLLLGSAMGNVVPIDITSISKAVGSYTRR